MEGTRSTGQSARFAVYSVASEQPLAHWDFYMSLAYFKAAVIDFRSRMAGSDHTEDRVGETVAPMIAAGRKGLRT